MRNDNCIAMCVHGSFVTTYNYIPIFTNPLNCGGFVQNLCLAPLDNIIFFNLAVPFYSFRTHFRRVKLINIFNLNHSVSITSFQSYFCAILYIYPLQFTGNTKPNRDFCFSLIVKSMNILLNLFFCVLIIF